MAERAGTTTAAIYRRWGSKSELVTQAVFRTDGDDVVADTGDVAADLATMVRLVGREDRPPGGAGRPGRAPRRVPHRRVRRSTSASHLAHRVEQRLERAKATGEIRADVDSGSWER